MRVTSLVVILGAFLVVASAHECVHDDLNVDLLEAPELLETDMKEYEEAKWEPLRIHYDLAHLDKDPDQRTCFKTGQKVYIETEPSADIPACTGEIKTECYRTCSEHEVLTPKRKKIIIELIETIKTDLGKYLKVKRRPLKFRKEECYGFTLSPATKAVTDTDLIIAVGARATEATSGAAAWATACELGRVDNRPVLGMINLLPQKVEGGVGGSTALSTARHEVTHVLGMSGMLMRFYRGYGGQHALPENKVFGQAGEFKTLITPKVTSFVREHIQCADACGAPLENNGGGGTVGSHWEISTFFTEIMTGVGGDGRLNTRLSGAMFEDSGWYHVDKSQEQPLRFGKGMGCDFLRGCTGYPSHYSCDRARVPEEAQACAYDGVTPSRCNLPFDVRIHTGCYFRNPISFGQCNIDKTPSHKLSSVKKTGEVYSPTSLCFSGTAQFGSKPQSFATPHCYKAQCDESTDPPTVKVTVGDKGTFRCPADNTKPVEFPASAGISGSLYCPSVDEVCPEASESCPASCANIGGACVDGECICPPGIASPIAGVQCKLSKCAPKPPKTIDAPRPKDGECVSVYKAIPAEDGATPIGPCRAKNFCSHTMAVKVNCRAQGNIQVVRLPPKTERTIRCDDGVRGGDLLLSRADDWISPHTRSVDEESEEGEDDDESYLSVNSRSRALGKRRRKKDKKKKNKGGSVAPKPVSAASVTVTQGTPQCPTNPAARANEPDGCYCNFCNKLEEYKCK